MHSVNKPADEAKRLYVEQSGIIETVRRGDTCTVWDVGLGAGTNAMELIHALEQLSSPRGALRLISFEKDLNPLRLALAHANLFPHSHHAAPAKLLTQHIWRSDDGSIEWELLEGDFAQRMSDARPPHSIWYDPFSYKVNTDLWSVESFQKLLAATRGEAARLYTYSASTAVRASMLCAGWYVGRGQGSGPKAETTVAFTPSAANTIEARHTLLGLEWLARWERSDARGPIGGRADGFESAIREHPQFSTLVAPSAAGT